MKTRKQNYIDVLNQLTDKGFTQSQIKDIVNVIVNSTNEQMNDFVDYTYSGEFKKVLENVEITKEQLIFMLEKADVISIDDSPLLNNWEADDGSIIDTCWNEDDLEFDCVIYDVDSITVTSNIFTVKHDFGQVTKLSLFQLNKVGV